MTLPTTVARILVDGALAAWFGTMAFFSFVAAPRAFAVLGRETAGSYVNEVFPQYYVLGVGLGVLGLLGSLGVGVLQAFALPVWVALAATAVATLAHAYARWSLIPKMEAAGEDAFEQYHGRSVQLNGLAMLAVAVAFVASHL